MSAVAEVDLLVEEPVSTALNLVDEQHPWLGLDSFSEETRQFFHGREEEVAELARRVQRKTLSILFGQSGLGKTSILRAGIVPRLRREGYCPVYVRIDYNRESPAPSQQIKQAIFRATEGAGKWTRPGTAVPGESLCEFLHHRDDLLVDDTGRPVTPLLIFDQFEEIFTLGQDDAFGRERAAEFLEDLADLVENRAPRALEMMLETEDSIVERFDFNRADYRILIALREDYLPHLEGLKAKMPSISQNRMRLARMTGTQALFAVMKPGGRLVSEEVAESIVRFVAGGSELRNAEVEPSLLSLVCRELNNARIAQSRSEISADLLAGSRETILHDFYERALADQPEGVRRFIEDEMLTESGFRESLAEERVQRAFAAAGAAPGALAALVNRRLLRIEERLDLRRVEVTHDVLCKVVLESREMRHAREAKEETERQLAAQREREAATHRALVRARKIAAGCAGLAILAVAGAFFGYLNMKRAQEAEAAATQTRTMAEGARGEAEKLIAFLLDDFYVELEPVGRLDVVGDLAKRALDYYAGLPKELRTPETDRNRALALVRYAFVLRNQARLEEGEKVAREANDILGRLHAAGDRSEVTAIGRGMGLSALARVLDSRGNFDAATRHAAEAVEAYAPLMAGPSPSIRTLRAYSHSVNYLGFLQMRQDRDAEGAASLEKSRDASRRIFEQQPGDLAAIAAYAESSAWRMEPLGRLDRKAEARAIGEEAVAAATRILRDRPGHMNALRARALAASNLSTLEGSEYRIGSALRHLQQSEDDWQTLLKHDPGNTVSWNNLGSARLRQSFHLAMAGRSQEGLAKLRSTFEIEKLSGRMSANTTIGLASFHALYAGELADYGDMRGAQAALADVRRLIEAGRKMIPAESLRAKLIVDYPQHQADRIVAIGGDPRAVVDRMRASRDRLAQGLALAKGTDALIIRDAWVEVSEDLGRAQLAVSDYAGAEKTFRAAVAERARSRSSFLIRQLQLDEDTAFLALALARQGNFAEAAKLIEPQVRKQRALAASDMPYQRVYLAQALLAAAAADPGNAKALLAEASTALDRLPADISKRRTVGELRNWINRERAKHS